MKKWKGKRQKGHWMGTVAPLALGFVAVIYDQQKRISSVQSLMQSDDFKKWNEISIETLLWVMTEEQILNFLVFKHFFTSDFFLKKCGNF